MDRKPDNIGKSRGECGTSKCTMPSYDWCKRLLMSHLFVTSDKWQIRGNLHTPWHACTSAAVMQPLLNPLGDCGVTILLKRRSYIDGWSPISCIAPNRRVSKYRLYLDIYFVTEYCDPWCDDLDAAGDEIVDASGAKRLRKRENMRRRRRRNRNRR